MLLARFGRHTSCAHSYAQRLAALGVDLSNTVSAANTAEKLIAHEIALAHKVAIEQAKQTQYASDPKIEIKRLQLSARMPSPPAIVFAIEPTVKGCAFKIYQHARPSSQHIDVCKCAQQSNRTDMMNEMTNSSGQYDAATWDDDVPRAVK